MADLRGISGGADGRLISIDLGDAPSGVAVYHEDASIGTVANRISLPGNADTIIPGGSLVLFEHRDDRWRLMGYGPMRAHAHSATLGQGGQVAHSALSGITATDHHVAPAAGPDANVTVDAAGAAGTASTFARSGHGHQVATYASNPASLGTAAPGTSGTAPSRGDHVHGMPADPVPPHERKANPHPQYLLASDPMRAIFKYGMFT